MGMAKKKLKKGTFCELAETVSYLLDSESNELPELCNLSPKSHVGKFPFIYLSNISLSCKKTDMYC